MVSERGLCLYIYKYYEFQTKLYKNIYLNIFHRSLIELLFTNCQIRLTLQVGQKKTNIRIVTHAVPKTIRYKIHLHGNNLQLV